MISMNSETGSFILRTSEQPEIPVKPSILLRRNYSHLKAFLCAFLCCVLSTLCVLQFRLYPWLPSVQAAFFSHSSNFFVGLPLWIAVSRLDGSTLTILKTDKGWLYFLLVCVLSTLEKQLCFQALNYIPSTIVFISQSSGPFFAVLLSRVFFKERLTVLKSVAFIVTVTSVILTGFFDESVYDVGETTNLALGIVLALLWSLAVAMLIVVTKKVSALDVFFVSFVLGLFGTLVSGILLLTSRTFRIPICGVCGVVLLLSALSSIVSGVAFYYSCKFGDPGRQSAYILAMNIVLSLIWEMAFFGRVFGPLEYAAVSLALIGTALNGFERQVSRFIRKQINAFFPV